MPTWQEILEKQGHMPEWPYKVDYGREQEIETDVLVIGGGIAGCWAAISAARQGVNVALVEKGATIRSGAGGPGCDHWCDTATNPLSKVNPDDWARKLTGVGRYGNGIGRQIQCRENYDTLLELEKMGGKIRDYEGQFKDEQGYDPQTKFLISPRANPFHDTNVVIRVWGTTFKSALKKECLRLGVKIFDRVAVTSLLNEKGIQGSPVVGATGVNGRTAEFMIFKSRSTIIATAGIWSLWYLNTELAGYNVFRSRLSCGDGAAMAWRAGAALTMMEKSTLMHLGTGYKHTWYTGAGDASYENVPLVDANSKILPVVHEPGWGKTMGPPKPGEKSAWETIREGVEKGEYALPFYGDFPAMPESERRVTWGMLLKEESTTRNIVDTYSRAGFDPDQDMLQAYQVIEGTSPAQWREASGGGPVIDWNLKTTLDGLYAAGEQLFSPGDHSFAASTGRYAGRKAAGAAKQTDRKPVSREQIDLEKARVYAPVKRENGLEWKELHAGISRVMQYYCSQYKTEHLLNIGLDSLNEIQNEWVPRLHAPDPHKLVRSLEDTSLLTCAQIITHASLARRASSHILDFHRIDYPMVDPPEWQQFVTLKLEGGQVKSGSLPADYYGDMVANYEAYNRDYHGVYQR